MDLILHVQSTLNAYGKYQPLFWAALIYLFFKKKDLDKIQGKNLENNQEKNQEKNQDKIQDKYSTGIANRSDICWYSMVALLLLWNPLFVYPIVHVFPEVAAYWQLLWVLPVEIVIAYAMTTALMDTSAYRDRKSVYWGYVAAALLLFAMAGTVTPYTNPTVGDVREADNIYGIQERDMEALQCLDQAEDAVVLLAGNDVLQASRRYNGNITTLYGSNLWNGNVPSDTTDGYEEQYYELYNLMQSPVDHEEEITRMAADMGCTYLVISNGRREQEEAEIPRDPNEIVDLTVDVEKWCLNGYEVFGETTYYHVLHRAGSVQ